MLTTSTGSTGWTGSERVLSPAVSPVVNLPVSQVTCVTSALEYRD